MILDTCKTVDEAIQIAKKIRISQSIWPVHFFICDASGNYRILEYQHGDLHIFGNDHKQIPVLTNSSYQESLSCLDGKEYVDELVDPYRYQSIDRFLKAKILVSKANDFIGSPENTGFNILSQVATPDTLWGFVYNASHPSLQVKDFVNKSKAIFSLNDFDFSIEAPWKLMEICSKRDILCDLTMQDYSFNMNKKMVESFFNNKHVIAQIGYHVPVEGIMHYSIYPEKLS
jgi:penicillin V acylase-like amidase (Ntn superfamily)